MNFKSGEDLIKLRNHIGISQSGLAELSNIKQAKISSYELGKNLLNKNEFEKILFVLNNNELLNKVKDRKKRYQFSEKKNGIKNSERRRKYKVSDRNREFLSELNNLWESHLNDEKNINTLSLFSGCGGFSLGSSAAGYNILGNIEISNDAQRIYSLNFKSEFLSSDISKVSEHKLKELRKSLPKIQVIIGGPPCQGFSLTGKRDKEDKRNYLFKDYLRFVAMFSPKIAVMENVDKLLSMKNKEGELVIFKIEEEFKKIGYKIQYKKFNTSDFGVPQNRFRVFFVAVRDDINKEPSFPSKMYEEPNNQLNLRNVKEKYNFADAVSDLPFLESGENSNFHLHKTVDHPQHVIDWLWNVPEGKSAHDNESEDMRPPSGYNTTYKRQYWMKPASTVQTTFGMISGSNNVHPIATRSLTIREAARIQSFPDEFIFKGTKSGIRRSIGNAVPPLFAKYLMSFLRDEFF